MSKRTKKKKHKAVPFYIEEVATGTKLFLALNPNWPVLEINPPIQNRGVLDFVITKQQHTKLYNYLVADPLLIRGLIFKAILTNTGTVENFVVVVHFSDVQVTPTKVAYYYATFSGISNLMAVEAQHDYPKELLA